MSQGKNDKLEQCKEDVRKAEAKVSYYDRLLNTPSVDAATKAIKEGMDLLRAQQDVNLETIKDGCQSELQRFINLRGSIDRETGAIHLLLMSISSSNQASTINKIRVASDLMDKIGQVDSLAALKDLLAKEPTNMDDDFTAVLGKCMVITQFATEYSKPNTP